MKVRVKITDEGESDCRYFRWGVTDERIESVACKVGVCTLWMSLTNLWKCFPLCKMKKQARLDDFEERGVDNRMQK